MKKKKRESTELATTGTKKQRAVARLRERQIARLMLAGKSVKEIAKKMGYSFHSVYNVTQRETFQEQLQILEKDIYGAADRELGLLYRDSVRSLRKLLKEDHPEVVLAALEKSFKVTGRMAPQQTNTYEQGVERFIMRGGNGNGKQLPAQAGEIIDLPADVVEIGKSFLKQTSQIHDPNYPIRNTTKG